jgi:hypothetical protein
MQKTLFISKPLKQSAEKRLKQKRGPRGRGIAGGRNREETTKASKGASMRKMNIYQDGGS